MKHSNDSADRFGAEVDLNFAAGPAIGSLPDAVDADGMPVSPAGPEHPADVRGELGTADDRSPSAPASATVPEVVNLPRGDWTKVGADGRKLTPTNPRTSALAKAIIAMLALMLIVPIALSLLNAAGDLGTR